MESTYADAKARRQAHRLAQRERIRDLIARARDGDREAFGGLYEEYYPQVFFFLLKHTKRPDTAEELAQETFAKALQKLPKTDEQICQSSRFGGWLYQIARNLFLDQARHEQLLHWSNLEWMFGPAVGAPGLGSPREIERCFDRLRSGDGNPEAEWLRTETCEAVRVMLGRLRQRNGRYGTVVVLCYVQGYSLAQIAHVLHTTRPAVKSLLCRARQVLRELWAQEQQRRVAAYAA